MTSLVTAYQANNIREFEKVLATHRATILEDPFIRNYVEDLLRKIRTQVGGAGGSVCVCGGGGQEVVRVWAG
jgi:hypothetical protein